jgi:hypothetical protein
MSPTVLPKIFDANLTGVRRALEQGERKGFTPEQAEELFGLCQFLANVVEWSWARVRDELREGTEGLLLSRALRAILDQVEETLRIYAKFRGDIIAAPPAYPALKADLDSLEKSSAAVERIRQQMASLLGWVETPLPRLDIDTLPKGEESPTAEGYESGDRILERLLSGEDL